MAMNVLVACECSGRVKTAFRNLGHNAWSCDLKPSEIPDDKFHIQGDIVYFLDGKQSYWLTGIAANQWDLVIAHPDCRSLANSGVRWFYSDGKINLSRMEILWEAAAFFNWCLNLPVPRICVENPIQHKFARQFIRKYDQIIQPHYFGVKESKATCLWLKGLRKLTRQTWIPKEEIRQSVFRMPPSDYRKADRARTFQGIADAMANQWGSIANER